MITSEQLKEIIENKVNTDEELFSYMEGRISALKEILELLKPKEARDERQKNRQTNRR